MSDSKSNSNVADRRVADADPADTGVVAATAASGGAIVPAHLAGAATPDIDGAAPSTEVANTGTVLRTTAGLSQPLAPVPPPVQSGDATQTKRDVSVGGTRNDPPGGVHRTLDTPGTTPSGMDFHQDDTYLQGRDFRDQQGSLISHFDLAHSDEAPIPPRVIQPQKTGRISEQNDKRIVVQVKGSNHTKTPPLPKYGGTAQEDLDSWLDRVYTTKAVTHASESDAFDNAVLHLIGTAWDEFRINKNDMDHTLAALSNMLRKRFQPVDYGRQCLQKFLAIKQAANESAVTFSGRFRSGLLKVPKTSLPDETVLELFVNAFRPAYRAELERIQPTSLTEAYEVVPRVERIVSGDSTVINLVSDQRESHAKPSDDGLREMLEKVLHAVQSQNDTRGRQSAGLASNSQGNSGNFSGNSQPPNPQYGTHGTRRQVRCFVCDSVLHIMRDCPHKHTFAQRRNNEHYGERGNDTRQSRYATPNRGNSGNNLAPHNQNMGQRGGNGRGIPRTTSGRSANGWAPRNTQTGNRNGMRLPHQRDGNSARNNPRMRPNRIMMVAPENAQYSMSALIPIQVGTQSVNGLFDTGAQISIIQQQLADKLCREKIAFPVNKVSAHKLQGAAGNELTQGVPVRLKFNVSNEEFEWTFIPVENLQTSLLFGMDFMNKEQIVIDLSSEPSSVFFSKRNISVPFREMFRSLQKYEPTKSVLFIKGEPGIIPPHTTKSVKVEHAHNDPFALATRNGMVLTRAHTRVNTPLRVVPGIVNFERGTASISVFNVSSSPFYLDGFSAVAEVIPTDPSTPLRANDARETINLVWSPPEEGDFENEREDILEFDFGTDLHNLRNFGGVASPTADDSKMPESDSGIKQCSDSGVSPSADAADFRAHESNYEIPGRFLL